MDLGCGCGESGPSGCDNECGSTAEVDECGVCGGDGSTCQDSYYVVDLQNTGENQLVIFQNSISSLDQGDEIGVFDLQGITNYNDCSNQLGEVLVGSGVWNDEQLNISAIGSVDLCSFGGAQFSGYVEDNPLVVLSLIHI